MTMASLVQKFRLGDRVRPKNHMPFFIDAVWVRGGLVEYSGIGHVGYSETGRVWYGEVDLTLTLAPELPPYVPSERRVILINKDYCRLEGYRCETDAELTERHAAEWAEYYAQGDEA